GQILAAPGGARDLEQVVGTPFVDRDERIENRGDQALPTVVRLAGRSERLDGRLARLRTAFASLRLRVLLALQCLERQAEGATSPGRMTELAGKPVQQALRTQFPPGARQLVAHDV